MANSGGESEWEGLLVICFIEDRPRQSTWLGKKAWMTAAETGQSLADAEMKGRRHVGGWRNEGKGQESVVGKSQRTVCMLGNT